MSKLNTKIKLPKPTKKEINLVLELGVEIGDKNKKVTDIIKRDFHHRDKKTNKTQLTEKFDNILAGDNEDMKEDIKGFIKKQVQTMIKEKPVQFAILGDEQETHSVTIKKVTLPMIENIDGIYDNFNETDLGSYRVVKIAKPQKEELTLGEELLKWMRSQKKNGLYTGSKGMEKELEFYDFETVLQIAENAKKGII
tara:strand:- start:678 stop:1265 length:588 start_codon:yes stop_codon:yes gene_type:complete